MAKRRVLNVAKSCWHCRKTGNLTIYVKLSNHVHTRSFHAQCWVLYLKSNPDVKFKRILHSKTTNKKLRKRDAGIVIDGREVKGKL